MGDALCGPSNALQSFQKHASVDRTLQQDRLTLRQGPSQGFRSAPGANVGALDPEFDAFQAGFSGDAPQPVIHQPFVPPAASGINNSFLPAASLPSWATDFQRLNISSPMSHIQASKQPAVSQVVPHANAASWHQDFLSGMPPVANSPGIITQTPPPFGAPATYYPTFQPTHQFGSQFAGQEAAKEPAISPAFDDAAFERAFEAAHADFLESSLPSVDDTQQLRAERMADGRLPEEANPLMRLTWERQPVTYLVVKIWNAFGLSTDGTPFQQDSALNAAAFLSELEHLQNEGRLIDDNEILRTRKILSRILQLDNVPDDGQYHFISRAQDLLDKVEGRSEAILNDSSHAGELLGDLDVAQNMESEQDLPREVLEEQVQELIQDPGHDDEELARTAAQLLDSVSDNNSKKFQESNFLGLMRKLRDREVRVEGDKMVETSQPAGDIQFDDAHMAPIGSTEAGGDNVERFT